jgi:hypothetical protein
MSKSFISNDHRLLVTDILNYCFGINIIAIVVFEYKPQNSFISAITKIIFVCK